VLKLNFALIMESSSGLITYGNPLTRSADSSSSDDLASTEGIGEPTLKRKHAGPFMEVDGRHESVKRQRICLGDIAAAAVDQWALDEDELIAWALRRGLPGVGFADVLQFRKMHPEEDIVAGVIDVGLGIDESRDPVGKCMEDSSEISLSVVSPGGETLVPNQKFSASDLAFELQRHAQTALGKPVHTLLAPPPSSCALDVSKTIQASGLLDGSVVTAVISDSEEKFALEPCHDHGIDNAKGHMILSSSGKLKGEIRDIDYDGTETNGYQIFGHGRWERSDHDKLLFIWEEQLQKHVTYENGYGAGNIGRQLGTESFVAPWGGPVKWHGHTFTRCELKCE
jgi:hypothetical protein